MAQDPVLADGSWTVGHAIRMMSGRGVHSLLVSRRTHEDYCGIMTRKDVAHKIMDPGKNPHDVKALEVMTKPVFVVAPTFALKYCDRLLHHATVLDGQEIVGIVSNTDIFNGIKV